MNPKRKRKLFFILTFVFLLGIGASLVLYALKQNINLFYTPSELLTAQISENQTLRLGGYVKKGTVEYGQTGEEVQFVITDRKQEVTAHYQGVLPNLFREGQTVVVTGKLGPDHLFYASEVLAKHDEKYIPKGLATELTKGDNHAA